MHFFNGFKIPLLISLLVIMLIPLVVTQELAYVFITGKNFTFRIAVEILFASYLVLMLYDKTYQPKNSLILLSFGGFVGVSLLSAIVGVDPSFSVWGSYLRMDGIVTLVHLLLYFIVLSHVLTTNKAWDYFFYVTVFVAFVVAAKALFDANPASTLGNLQYAAVYLFFSLFFTALVFVRTSSKGMRFLLLAVAAFIGFVMLQSGERGVLCALMVAVFMSIAVFSYYKTRSIKPMLALLALGVCLLGLFLFLLSLNLVQGESGLSKYLNPELFKQGASVRGHLWLIALQGFTEHPFLGWGMNNFIYVFNQFYNPIYCNHELWMDKVHNNYLECLVTGGVVGFIAFLALLLAPFYYLLRKGQETFSASELSVLWGLFSGYLVINLFYFDTLTSSICFVSVLSYLHFKVSVPFKAWTFPKKYIPFTVLPAVVIATSASVYYLTVPSLLAARESMLASQLSYFDEQQVLMHKALARGGVGSQEILEKYNPVVLHLLSSKEVPFEQKQRLAQQTVAEYEQFIAAKPKEPRTYYLLISLAMVIGDFDKAKQALSAVQKLTPNKEYTMMIEGVLELAQGHLQASKALFEKSICLHASKFLYDDVSQRLAS